MPPGLRLSYVPHGFNHDVFQGQTTSPYSDPVNAVSVGSMLFDDKFFKTACRAFPEVKFHIIGGGRRSQRVTEPNATVLPEMAFHETVRYIVHASIGIAAYDKAATPYYLSDTSMKLAQYAYVGLNSVCPLFAAGGKPGRFGYEFIRPFKHCRSVARSSHHTEGSARRLRVFELARCNGPYLVAVAVP